MNDEFTGTRERLAFVKANAKPDSRVPYRWFVIDVELLLARLEQAEAAAAHFFHCPTCRPGRPCPEGWAYVAALGLKGASDAEWGPDQNSAGPAPGHPGCATECADESIGEQMTDDWMKRAERAEHLLIALVSGDEAGLVCAESDWICAYCAVQPDMSAAVVSMQHGATCPITQARALLQRLGLLR